MKIAKETAHIIIGVVAAVSGKTELEIKNKAFSIGGVEVGDKWILRLLGRTWDLKGDNICSDRGELIKQIILNVRKEPKYDPAIQFANFLTDDEVHLRQSIIIEDGKQMIIYWPKLFKDDKPQSFPFPTIDNNQPLAYGAIQRMAYVLRHRGYIVTETMGEWHPTPHKKAITFYVNARITEKRKEVYKDIKVSYEQLLLF